MNSYARCTIAGNEWEWYNEKKLALPTKTKPEFTFLLICLNKQSDGAICDTENSDRAECCQKCGTPLTAALSVQNPGALIDQYRIRRMIGHGRFGAVYAAEYKDQPQVKVALKEMFAIDSVRHLVSEFFVLRHLQHDHLPRYYDMFEVQGNGYLVMEFVPGQSLKDVLDKKRGPLPEAQVLGYLIQLCDVLHYLHTQQPPILHRDIKPHNIRVTPEGLIKLVDFGMFKQLGDGPASNPLPALTRAYAAPEQWNSQASQRSDIYSLGATLYHLLSGYAPPSASRRIAQSSDPIPAIQQVNRRLSVHVAEAVMTALQLSAEQRYADVITLRQSLITPYATHMCCAVAQPASACAVAMPAPVPVPPPPPEPPGDVAEKPLRIFREHTAAVSCVVFSGDGTMFASASDDGCIHLRRVCDTTLMHVLHGHNSQVTDVAFSPTGEYIASGSNREWFLWHVQNGILLKTFKGFSSYVSSVAFSPDGSLLAGGSSDGTVWLWRVADGILLKTLWGHRDWVNSMAFSPDGSLLATGSSDQTIRLWSIPDGILRHDLHEHANEVTSVAFSLDGSLLASASWDYRVRLWDVAGGRVVRTFHDDHSLIYSVAVHPGGQIVASGNSNHVVQLWRIRDGNIVNEFRNHRDAVRSVAFSPDGALLASGGSDQSVQWWQVTEQYTR